MTIRPRTALRPLPAPPLAVPAALLFAAAVLSPGAARAERAEWIIENEESHPELFLSAVGGWYLTGFGAEARFSFPIAPNGAIDYLNDSFSLEFGAGYQFFLGNPNFQRLTFPLMVRWDFHLTPMWTVYGALGAAGGYPFDLESPVVFGYHGYVWFVVAVGAFLHLADWFSLRMEAGSLGVLVGPGFRF